MIHYCYILKNNENNKTYNGYTNNINRRIKQHNGILKGGAKATSSCNSWYPYCVLTGFETKEESLSCEWKIKHPTNKKIRPKEFTCSIGRIKSLNIILNLDTWTSKSTGLSNGKEYILYIDKQYVDIIDKNNIKQNVTICDINELFSKEKTR